MPGETQFKICPKCQTNAALTAPYCLVCGRKFNTQFAPPTDATRVFTTPNLNPQAAPPIIAEPAIPHSRSPFGNMATVGFRLIITGVILAAYFFLFFDTSVPVGTDGDRVHNIGLMQQQTLGLISGASIGIIGAILTAAGYSKGEPIDWRGVLFGKNGVVVGTVAAFLLLVIAGISISSSRQKQSVPDPTPTANQLEMERRFHSVPPPD